MGLSAQPTTSWSQLETTSNRNRLTSPRGLGHTSLCGGIIQGATRVCREEAGERARDVKMKIHVKPRRTSFCETVVLPQLPEVLHSNSTRAGAGMCYPSRRSRMPILMLPGCSSFLCTLCWCRGAVSLVVVAVVVD